MQGYYGNENLMIFNITKKYDKKDYYLYVYGNQFSSTFSDYDLDIRYPNLDIRYPNHYSQLYKLSPEIFLLASLKNNPLKEYKKKIRKFVPISQQIVYKNRLNY